MQFLSKAGGVLAASALALGLAALPTPAYAAPIACDEAALVAAIDAANTAGGGTIDLAPNCVYTLDTVVPPVGGTGPNGLPVIQEDITINGFNSIIERSTVTGTPEFRIFEVGDPNGELTLNRVTLRNGNPGAGESGGAILVNSGRVLAVNASTITNNTASARGGGIRTSGTTSVVSTTLSGNTAGTYGGALSNSVGSLSVKSSRVNGNTAGANGAGGIDSNGGGTLTVDSSFVTNNSSPQGGGIWSSGATATVTDTHVTNNTSSGEGGGIFNGNDSTFSIRSSRISDNDAASDGGGIHNDGTLNINSSSFQRNETDSRGGGLYNDEGTATLTSSSVTGNTAGDDGGGIYEDPGSTVNLVSTSVSSNLPNNCRPPGAIPGCNN